MHLVVVGLLLLVLNKMTLIEKIGLIIFIVIMVLIVIFLPKEELTKFQLDLESFGVQREMAKNIDLYFRDERDYLTWNETQEIIRVYNLVYVEAGRPDLVGDINDIINQLNLLIE